MKEQIKYIISTLVIISITIVWVNAWNWLTASNWDTLDVTKWNSLVNSTVPSWAIMSFYLTSCHAWWIAADWTNSTPDLRWTFIRWIWWDINWRDSLRTLWNYQIDSLKDHIHYRNEWNLQEWPFLTWPNWTWNYGLAWQSNFRKDYYPPNNWLYTWSWIWLWTETRPKNIALLYCMKQ